MTDPAARRRLTEERLRVVHRLALLRGDHDGFVAASRDSNADDEHDPEGTTIAFERAQVEALTRQGEQRLSDVDQALARLDVGAYGRCERCGADIAAERLEARPTATTCVRC